MATEREFGRSSYGSESREGAHRRPWSRRGVLRTGVGLAASGLAAAGASDVVAAGPPPGEAKYPNVIPPDLELGDYGYYLGQFIEPSGVSVGSDDRLYVVEEGNDRVQVFGREGRLLEKWGATGSGRSELSAPRDVTTTADGTVYVADTGNHRVQGFTSGGMALGGWGAFGDGPGEFAEPEGVAADHRRVYVADTGNHRIQVFDRRGEFRFSFGGFGEASGRFNEPLSVSVDADGAIYVADAYNNRIQKFDADGNYVDAWGEYGSTSGLLAEPTGVSVRGDEVFVADKVNHRIQVFDTGGTYRYQWGRHPPTAHEAHEDGTGRLHYPQSLSAGPDATDVFVAEPFENRCKLFTKDALGDLENVDDSAWWEKATRFHYGAKPAFGTLGYLAVSEPDTHSIVLFDATGDVPEKITRIGGFGSDPGQFISPTGVAFDSEAKRLFVSDKGNNRVQTFSLESGAVGEHVAEFGRRGTERGQFREPSGMDVDGSGNLFVVDNNNNRVQVFGPGGELRRTWGGPGAEAGQFNAPMTLALGPDDERVHVVDTYNYRVQVFDRAGELLNSWGGPGPTQEAGRGRFVWPFGITTAPDGSVFVSDPGGQRIQKFGPDGEFLTEWGSFGTGEGEFYKPKGLACDGETLYVVDFGNHRGQMFTTDGEFVDLFGVDEFQPPERSCQGLLGGIGCFISRLFGGLLG